MTHAADAWPVIPPAREAVAAEPLSAEELRAVAAGVAASAARCGLVPDATLDAAELAA